MKSKFDMDALSRLIVTGLLAASLAACGGDGKGEVEEETVQAWPKPACDHPEGAWNVAFTADAGSSVQYPVNERPASRFEYTPGLLVLDEPGWMLASRSDDGFAVFTISRDAGCTWEELGEIEDMLMPVLVEADGRSAYAWDWFSDKLVFIDPYAEPAKALDLRHFTSLLSSGGQVHGVATAVDNRDHVAYFDSEGVLYYSTDGGLTWPEESSKPVQSLPSNTRGRFYQAAFSRFDLGHVIIGTVYDGMQYTVDGGENWEASSISSVGTGDINCFDVRYMPGSDDVAWALCIDIDESTGGASTQGRHLYRSMDGGLTFQALVDSMPDKSLSNGTVFLPVPGRPDEVYYTFFSCFNPSPADDDLGGTDIYHYDAGTGEITEYWHTEMTGLQSGAFHPEDPTFIYLGLNQDPRC